MTKQDPHRARKKLALKIATLLADFFYNKPYDIDEARALIDAALPFTRAEAEAAVDALLQDRPRGKPSSISLALQDIRHAVGLPPDAPLAMVLRVAADQLQELSAGGGRRNREPIRRCHVRNLRMKGEL